MTVAARTFAGLILSVIVAAAAGAAGQAPVAPEAPADDRAIVVVGCVVHESEYAGMTAAPRVGAPADIEAEFVIVPPAGSGSAFRVTGMREADLVPHVGRSVEVAGTVEPPRLAATPATIDASGDPAGDTVIGTAGQGDAALPPGTRSGAAGVTPQGGPAHEPGDALPGTAPTGTVLHDTDRPARPSADSPAVDVVELPRLNLTSVRRVDGACDVAPATSDARRQGAATGLAGAPARETTTAPAATSAATRDIRDDVSVTVIGCVMRSTPTGPVAGAPDGPLTLTRASIVGGDRSAAAPPAAADRGSGTLRREPQAGEVENRAFVLVPDATMDLAPLAEQAGRRAEVTGVIEGGSSSEIQGAAPPPPAGGHDDAPTAPVLSTAHPSAPVAELRVTAFRPAAGTCF